MAKEAYIVSATRTAIARIGGALKGVQPQELMRTVLEDIIERTGVPKAEICEIIAGQTRQSTDAANMARYAALLAGFPESVPAYTVMQQCSSGMLAVQNGANDIALGYADIVIAGGVESMSNAPFYIRNARYGLGTGSTVLADSVTEGQLNSQPEALYGSFSMGVTAENLAEAYRISREEQDRFAFESQSRYRAAYEAGRFRDEIVPVVIPQRKGAPVRFDVDEHPRLTSPDQLAVLKPAFREGGTVTAGNSCGRNDGACAVMLMSADAIARTGVKPMARVVSHGCAGVDPRLMGYGPVPATRMALKRAGLTIGDMGLVELNEAFAAQSLVCIEALGLDRDTVNVNGGAIALGHPLGATGARILTTLLYEMQRRPQVRYGLATLCVGGGMGSAVIVERA